VAVALTLVQTKQIRINIHQQNNKKRSTNNRKTQYKQYKTRYIQVHILPKHPPHTLAHTLHNKFKQPQYKIHTK